MQVFKAYFKVMRGSATFLAISLGIFMSLAILFSSIAPKTAADKFEPTKTPIAVINRDGDSQLARGLVEYLGKTARVIPYPDDEEKLQDALFYRKVEYIAIIPPGFSDAFTAGEDAAIQKVIVPDSTSSHYVDMSIDRFFNAVRLHRLYGGEEDEASLVSAAMADLASDIPVTIMSSGAGNDGSPPPESYYYQYCAYALLAMIITGVSSVMITFNEKDLYMRNLCAPLPKRSMNLQLAAGHGVFALGCWGMLVVGSFILHSDTLLSSDLTGLYLLNTLVFAVVCTSIGFLIGSFVKSTGAQMGATNVIALGMSLLGGVFVPQSIMSKSVLAVAKFLPSYWYVLANNGISELSAIAGNNLRPVFGSMLVQLGFALAIFAVTLLMSKEQKVS